MSVSFSISPARVLSLLCYCVELKFLRILKYLCLEHVLQELLCEFTVWYLVCTSYRKRDVAVVALLLNTDFTCTDTISRKVNSLSYPGSML
jgi:hypothetical protein